MKSAWALALSAALMLLCSCTNPIHDQSKLRSIKAEARALEATHPIKPPRDLADVPASEWPPVIASLKPERVTVDARGVHVWIKFYFDDAWGYEIPHDENARPKPARCYSEPGPGVFWLGPC